LLPSGAHCPRCQAKNFRKESDILDVWFDSGSSAEAVLGKRDDLPWPADVYIEGGDQYRGWFHSSLLLGVGVHGAAPYRQVLTHGWTLDAQGKAMSKSLGNVIEPQGIVKDSGAEILRLWVASSEFKDDVRISKDMLVRLAEAYRKFRNTARFMLGNLYDFSPAENSVSVAELSEFDQWLLRQTSRLLERVYRWYETYEFHRIYHAVNEFVTLDLSAYYLDILKDRLYTAAPNSRLRRSSQTAIYRIVEALTRAMAPLYSFTCDEIWQFLPQEAGREESVHMARFVPAERLVEGFSEKMLQKLDDWDKLSEIRGEVLKVLETARKDKFIGQALEAKIQLVASGETLELLKAYQAFLPNLFIVSQVELKDQVQPDKYYAELDSLKILVLRADGKKCERCWNYSLDVGQDRDFETACGRCSVTLREMGYL
jgi:isoleucyl-tRNA synthetase